MLSWAAGWFDYQETHARRRGPAIAEIEQADWLPGMQTAAQGLQYAYTGGADCDVVDSSGRASRILRWEF